MKLLSEILRPKKLEEIVGQKHIIPFLEKSIKSKTPISLILYGEPGIGKTSLAYVLCNEWNVKFNLFNAANDNKKKLLEILENNFAIIIDEIHRLNKDKQDIILQKLEIGKNIVIATTTENPYFVVNPALRSRMHILELKRIENDDILKKMQKLKKDMNINISTNLLNDIIKYSNGDIRYCINIFELLQKLYKNEKITNKIIKEIVPTIRFHSDKNGDNHYDLLSAFHKSLRGSDINASIYYLSKLIKTGDIIGMERRLLAVVYEDIGLANPNIGFRLMAALDSAKKLGFPEARLPLSQITIEIANCAKSNSSFLAIESALELINNGIDYEIPNHLKDSHYKSSRLLNRGLNYKNPHNFAQKINQKYLPEKIDDKVFFIKNKNDKI